MINQMPKERTKLRVVAQKADPNVKFSKSQHGFQASVIYVLEDGQEILTTTSTRLKRDLPKRLAKLPIESVTGMEVELVNGRIYSSVIELFAYNGV